MRILVLIAVIFFSTPVAFAQRSVDFASSPQASDALIVAMTDAQAGAELTGLIGEAASANLTRAISAAGFTGEAGTSASFLTGAERFGEIHLVGLGDRDMRARDWEDFGGRAAGLAKSSSAERVMVLAGSGSVEDLTNAAFGAIVGQYSFDKYLSEAEPMTGQLVFHTDDAQSVASTFDASRRHKANAVVWARDMQSEPPNILYPEEFVRRARAEFQGVRGVSISVLDVRQMERMNMGAILGVGRGSARPPRMMIVRYNGGSSGEAPIVFAGKGITFDTGGISLKPNANMWKMKADMTGAAAVMGAAMSLAKSGAPVNIVAIAALAENMPGGRAIRPGDVLTSASGKTIEIMSTDAEGRLVLSDAVWYAQEQYNPKLLVDVATLTGSVGRALGDEYAGLFSRDDAIAARMKAAGDAAGEDLWRLPLHPNHNKQIKSVIADVKNADTGSPGASTGAAFIGSFVEEETPWAHLDIAGVDWRSEPAPTMPLGASGFGVRLLDQLARDSME